MIRKIVIPVRSDGKSENVFAHAAVLARRYKSHIAVTHCRPRGEDLMPYGVAISASLRKLLLSQSAEVANQVEEGMRTEIEALAVTFGVEMAAAALPDQASAEWIEEQGRQVDIIKRHGRLADLICVAKPDVDRNLGANTLKSALFNTGRPVMMCPMKETPPDVLCDKVAIAWNGSVEASRAVAATTGILDKASEVTILSGGIEIHGAESATLLNYLESRGVNARVERFTPARKKVGQELLETSVALNVDTLIMGAYSNSHERETFFGGNTQYIVDRAEFPVILVH